MSGAVPAGTRHGDIRQFFVLWEAEALLPGAGCRLIAGAVVGEAAAGQGRAGARVHAAPVSFVAGEGLALHSGSSSFCF